MSNEYEPELGDSPLRQGDVFLWQDDAYARPWRTYGVVVTADCDLAKDKTHGRLSYVPALLPEDYIWTFLRHKRFTAEIKSMKVKISRICNKHLIKSSSVSKEISEDTYESWINRVGPKEFVNELKLADPGQQKSILSLCERFVKLNSILQKDEPDRNLLLECLALKAGNKLTDEDIAKDFKGDFLSLPGDVFHLTTVEGREEGGIFLMLRHITQCNFDAVAVRPEQLRFGDAKAKRVGRIAAPYRYALTQNLGRVFSDIGLPDAYDDRRKNSSLSFFSRGGAS